MRLLTRFVSNSLICIISMLQKRIDVMGNENLASQQDHEEPTRFSNDLSIANSNISSYSLFCSWYQRVPKKHICFKQMVDRIPERWRVLSGQDKWKHLLDPLDIDLRRYILHYGDLIQAAYDAFNHEKESKYAGDCKYSRKHFFSRVGLENGNRFKYEVTKFLYATSSIPLPTAFIFRSLSREAWFKESNWIGYIAVATNEGKIALGRRDIVIAWRGTIQDFEWANDFEFPLVSASEVFPKATSVKVHKGWLSVYCSSDHKSPYSKTSAREQVLDEVERLLGKYEEEDVSITITGHSLGAALSVLNAADIVVNGFNKLKDPPIKPPVTVFGFGCPYVGDLKFKKMCDSMEDLHMLRIRNFTDQVPNYPLVELGYCGVGEQLVINTQKSEYLKFPGDMVTWHYLEAYLHGIAGTQGSKGGFKLEVKRDIALVNKSQSILKEDYLVPGKWWCLENKGMVQGEDGTWKLKDHEKEDDYTLLSINKYSKLC